MIDESDERALEQAIRAAQKQGQIQLQVLTLNSLQDTPIEDASFEIVKSWRLGGEKNDNGVLFLISKGDRRLRIEVGQGLEGDIPDVYAKRIVSDVVIPYFREGRTSDGIVAGVAQILKLAGGQPGFAQASPARSRKSFSATLNLIVFAIIILFSLFGPRRSRGLLGGALLGGMGGGWGGRGGFGGGGFGRGGGGWSGGGGGFSGGGASGGW